MWRPTKVEIRGDPNGWASASAYRFMEGKHRIQVSWIEIRSVVVISGSGELTGFWFQ